jgi:hypothetical protein
MSTCTRCGFSSNLLAVCKNYETMKLIIVMVYFEVEIHVFFYKNNISHQFITISDRKNFKLTA